MAKYNKKNSHLEGDNISAHRMKPRFKIFTCESLCFGHCRESMGAHCRTKHTFLLCLIFADGGCQTLCSKL